jgi:hypothetical protein
MRDELTVVKPVTAASAGGVVLLCAVVAGMSASVPGRGEKGNAWINYSPVVWPLLAVLLSAALVLALRPRLARPAAVVAAIVAAQVAGNGVVAVRDWFNVNGVHGVAQGNLATVVTYAAAVAVAATVAACVGLAVLWQEPVEGWRGVRPTRPVFVVAGVFVAVLLPAAIATAWHDTDLTTLGQLALTYSLPWGGGLAAVGWLNRRAATAAFLTVAGSVIVTAVVFLGPGNRLSITGVW